MTGHDESIVRDQAGQPGIHLVQAGWDINDQDGKLIGTVVARDEDTILVDLEGSDADRVRIPTRLIAEEEEASLLATLAVGMEELERVTPLEDDGSAPPLT